LIKARSAEHSNSLANIARDAKNASFLPDEDRNTSLKAFDPVGTTWR
jgi:hypothetical protein